MQENAMTAAERARIENRDHEINIDVERIKRDIAETARRHGFAEAAFSIEWPEHSSSDTPAVNFSGTLFA